MCRHKLLYFLRQKDLLLQRHVVVLQHETTARIFLDEVFVNGSSNHTLEHPEIDFGTVACSVLFQIFHISRHHVNRQLRHLQIFLVERVSRCIGKKVHELLQTVSECYAGVFRERRGFDELLAKLKKILVHVFSETIALPVLQERLLTFKTYLFSKGKSILVLHTFLLVAGMKPDIQVEVFFLAGVFDLVFRFTRHRSIGVKHLIAVLVKHGRLSPAEIIFKIEVGTSVAQFRLPELGILLLAIFYFCHKIIILRKDNPRYNNLKIAVYTP